MGRINKFITLVIAGLAGPTLSAIVMNILFFGGGSFFWALFLISLGGVAAAGIPLSLLIHRLVRSDTMIGHGVRWLLHVVAACLVVWLWASVFGGLAVAFDDGMILFYAAGAINATMYYIVFVLLKLTGDSGFSENSGEEEQAL